MTQENATATTGERPWPVALIIEELRLRSRRTLVWELERRGLWPDRARYRHHLRTQHALGERLRDDALRAALPATTFSLLRSRSIFGAMNRRVDVRLTRELAFGYELGAGLHALIEPDDEAGAVRAGTRCAIFNLGISYFDVVCDHQPRVAARLGGLLDEHVLRDLAGAPGRVARLARDAEALAEPELRLLLGVIAAFYALGPVDGEPSALAEQLVRAHRAQMLSVGQADVSRDLALAAAREKSTLPFAAIGVIAAGDRPDVDADVASRLAERVGDAFWLADDLADAAVDFGHGALNALLVEAYEGFGPGAYPHAGPGPLGRILEDGTIERTAETVAARLGEAVALADAAGGDAGARLGEVLVCALRDWLA